MDDIRAVMDAVESRQAVLYAISEGGPLALLFAASYSERVSALVVYGSFARMTATLATGRRVAAMPERVLATILFADIVDSERVLPASLFRRPAGRPVFGVFGRPYGWCPEKGEGGSNRSACSWARATSYGPPTGRPWGSHHS